MASRCLIAAIPRRGGTRRRAHCRRSRASWPGPRRDRSPRLGDEAALPFPDAFFDRILVVHGLEGADAARPLLRQLWRVLAPEGRLLLVAPNRTSLWAQLERSPFGVGRPFSRGELDRLLRSALFETARPGIARSTCRPSVAAVSCAPAWDGTACSSGSFRAWPASISSRPQDLLWRRAAARRQDRSAMVAGARGAGDHARRSLTRTLTSASPISLLTNFAGAEFR